MLRKGATAISLGLALAVAVTGTAQAKGAESVTLSGPGIDKPIELIDASISFDTYEDDAPVRLIGLIGLGSGRGFAGTTPPEELGSAYTLTWVMGRLGDPIELRTVHQYVYLDAVGGTLIHTPEQIGLDGWGANLVGWFEAPEELGPTIEDVIAWSNTEEGVAIQPITEPSTSAPEGPNPRFLLPILFALAAIGIGSFAVWRVRRPA